MSFSIKSTKIQILIFSVVCTLIIFNLNKNANISSNSVLNKVHFNLRNLITTEDVDGRCKNTPKDFLKKNYAQLKNEINKDFKIDKYQNVLIEMIEEKKLGKIKKYLPRIIIYCIVLIVDIIFIIIWFVFCGCCCCGKKYKSSANGCSKFYFFLFFLLSVIAILICAFGCIITSSFYKSSNAIICSLYKLVNHFIEGTKEDYSDNYWKGLIEINNITELYKNTSGEIQILNGNTWNPDDDKCNWCESMVQTLNTEISNNRDFTNSFTEANNIISSISKTFTDIDDILDKIESKMKCFDKYFKLGLYVLFFAILVFCLLGILTLSLYFICNIDCIKCLFHLFWNIEMLIILVTLLVGASFGIIGVLSKDAASILKYTISIDNLNKTNPLLLSINQKYVNETNECFNKDGELYSLLLKDNFYESSFDTYYSEYKNQNGNLPDEFKNLNEVMENMKSINDFLKVDNLKKNINCKFVQSDFMILITELKDSFAKKITLLAMVIILANLAAFLSIMFGIIIESNYKGNNEPEEIESRDRHIKMKMSDPRNNMDSSSAQIRK